jgi:molybdate transport repressor ModE-like protein
VASLLPNLRHLAVLRAVARHRSISAAAREVHLSQPAVTQAVAALERLFAAALFVRTARGVAPTPAGTACAARVARALEELGEALPEGPRHARAGAEPLRAITAAQLQALVTVVEAGGFGRAARAAGVARATVHRAARQLERAVGIPLFESTSHGVRPTREAERLARRAQLAAAELAQARAEVAAIAGAERGGTVIGAMPLARSVLVPSALLAFAARRPAHAIAVLDGPYESLLDALRRGRADVLVGALRETTPDDVVEEHLFDDPLSIIVRADHPLVLGPARGRPTREQLLRHPWIAPRAGSPLRRHFETLVGQHGEPGGVVPIDCNSLVAARALLLASDRVMLLSAHQVHHELATRQLAALPHPAGRVVRSIGLTTRRGWQPTVAQQDLLEELRRQARLHGEGRGVEQRAGAAASAAAPRQLNPTARPRPRGTRAAKRASGA